METVLRAITLCYAMLNGKLRPVHSYEDAIRVALTALLMESGIEPNQNWLSVRSITAPNRVTRHFVVMINSAPAKEALSRLMDELTGQNETARSVVGLWVMSEPEAINLCGGSFSRSMRAPT